MKKVILSAILLALGCGASLAVTCPDASTLSRPAAMQGKTIKPRPSTIDIYNLKNGTITATFHSSDIDWAKSTIRFQVLDPVAYSVSDVKNLKRGDVVLFEGERITVKKIDRQSDCVCINEGSESELYLVYENGTYVYSGPSDMRSYRSLGVTKLPLKKDFLLNDQRFIYMDRSFKKTSGQRNYINRLDPEEQEFDEVTLTISNGVVTKILCPFRS